jgi:hypothetical protein
MPFVHACAQRRTIRSQALALLFGQTRRLQTSRGSSPASQALQGRAGRMASGSKVRELCGGAGARLHAAVRTGDGRGTAMRHAACSLSDTRVNCMHTEPGRRSTCGPAACTDAGRALAVVGAGGGVSNGGALQGLPPELQQEMPGQPPPEIVVGIGAALGSQLWARDFLHIG